MGDARAAVSGQAVDMRTAGAATVRRTFWWDRARPVEADLHPLRAVVFDADTALADSGRGDEDLVPKAGLIDLVMSLFLAGIPVAMVSKRDRESTEMLVRQLVGDGLVETIVSGDDVDDAESDGEPYRLALWELGVTAESALAIGGTPCSIRAASAAGLPVLFVTDHLHAGHDFTDAAAVRCSYDDGDPLSADGCRLLHRRWAIQQQRLFRAA